MPSNAATVVLVGLENDAHVLRVAEECQKLGARTVVFDRHNPSHRIKLCVSDDSCEGSLTTEAAQLSLADVKAVWWRSKPFTPAEYNGIPRNTSEAFALREWRNTLKSLDCFTGNALWINRIPAQDAIALKPRQLALAREVSLRIPQTVFTNNELAAIDFQAIHQKVVYKVISHYFTVPRVDQAEAYGETIYTTEVSADHLHAGKHAIRKAPVQLQELLSKAHELRVNIVGDTVFSVVVDSQSDASTSLDWRHSQLRDMYFPTTLDSVVEKKLLEFHRRAGLTIAAYDLVVPSPDEEPVFLECNAGGQWLWIEAFGRQPITHRLAQLLTGTN